MSKQEMINSVKIVEEGTIEDGLNITLYRVMYGKMKLNSYYTQFDAENKAGELILKLLNA